MVSTAPNPVDSRPAQLPSLTGFRFFAALAVFLTHATYLNTFSDATYRDGYDAVFTNIGPAAVSSFFVLSGFVLTISHRDTDTTRMFWRRRFFRVYPMHILTFLFAAGAGIALLPAVTNVLLVNSWVPSYEYMIAGDPVSWSLSVDILFYLFFPLLYRWVDRIAVERLWTWVAGAIGLIIACSVFAELALPASPGMGDGEPVGLYPFYFMFQCPPVRMLECVVGMLMARVVLAGKWPRMSVGWPLALLGCAYALAYFVPYIYTLVAVWIIPITLLVPAMATLDLRGRRSMLRARVFTLLGQVSYSFYLTHVIVMFMLLGLARYGLGGGVGGVALIVLSLIACELLALVLYLLVERPVMRFFGTSRRRRRATAATRPAG